VFSFVDIIATKGIERETSLRKLKHIHGIIKLLNLIYWKDWEKKFID